MEHSTLALAAVALVAAWLVWRVARKAIRLAMLVAAVVAAGALPAAGELELPTLGPDRGCDRRDGVVRIRLSAREYPSVVDHLRDVHRSGQHARVWHLARGGAEGRRDRALEGIPARSGFDRDELPPAVAREGGYGADVRYVPSAENRAAGADMGGQLRRWCTGQRFRLVAAP